jgi:predicted SnoaL-like aldol condensation-catalyzing enzyme
MGQTIESKNKELVLEAFDRLFNKRDYEAAERYWSPNYIQHSAHIPPGRDGLVNLVKSIPPTLRYESGTVVAEGDFVILHILRPWLAFELDCGEHSSNEGWDSRGTLGGHWKSLRSLDF